MSVDDQLFKRDGSLITDIDIAILKMGRTISSYLFAKQDEETLNQALSRMIRTAGVIISFTSVPFCLAGESTIRLVLALFIGGGYIFLLSRGRCCGLGTNVLKEMKFLYLLAMLAASSQLLLEFSGKTLYSPTLFWGSKILYTFGFLLATLACCYVSRLNNKPPRKEKAKALKLVFNHT